MAQRTRVRTGRTAWVGALAVLCGGLTGCFNTDKKPLGSSPPQAKGSAGLPTRVSVQDPKTGQFVPQNAGGVGQSPYSGGATGITGTPGQYQPGTRPPVQTYDQTAGPGSINPAGIGTPARPSSGTGFNSTPSGGSPYTQGVTPAGGPGYGQVPGPNMNYVQPAAGSGYGGAGYSPGATTARRNDPPQTSLNDLGPVPPSPPSVGVNPPSVAPPNQYGPQSPTGGPISPTGSPHGR